ncbi:hypothetical protein BS329_38900 [Amycolatopsis coloradensis]|uniref:Uncharacterized protein n=1 Tax=Amycolatopsis coloradensis TaxID=76021 RepID=A0A1R0KEN7_9PSEU|nr:hypothetical protein [Amycolatopsis coloradensis]OLZ43629.1 hypothetical protein BS329_38900 [Amycolatopsis coloradensis]
MHRDSVGQEDPRERARLIAIGVFSCGLRSLLASTDAAERFAVISATAGEVVDRLALNGMVLPIGERCRRSVCLERYPRARRVVAATIGGMLAYEMAIRTRRISGT